MGSTKINKVAEVTLLFFVIKIIATTLGETAGDLLSMTLKVGYGPSSLILMGVLLITLLMQIKAKKFYPALFWLVILTTSIAGTTCSDYIDRTLKLGYATGALVLLAGLIMVLIAWRVSEKSLSVSQVDNPRIEIFYWVAILFSNALGTALGDYLADDSGLGFLGGALLIASIIAMIALLSIFTKVNRILLFWSALVLTRPFGATFGDLLTKPMMEGGLGFGTIGSSTILVISFIIFVVWSSLKEDRLLYK